MNCPAIAGSRLGGDNFDFCILNFDMISNSYPGFFVDIEGIDGAGQSTQATLVSQALQKEGYPVVVTRNAPKKMPIGKLIREALNHKVKVSLTTLEFLYAADHSDRQEKEVITALKKGKIIVADRSIWSFIAYGALEMDRDWLFNLVRHLIFPDLTILLKVTPQVALKRIAENRPARDFFEKEKTLSEVWQNYQWLAKKYSDRIRVIDGEKPIEAVTEEIVGIIREHPKFNLCSNKPTHKFTN